MADQSAANNRLILKTKLRNPDDTNYLLAFNAQSTRLAIHSDGDSQVVVFDPHSGREVGRVVKFHHLVSMDFLSADVLLLVQQPHWKSSGFTPGRCVRWDLRRGKRDLIWEHEHLQCVAVNHKGRVVAFGADQGLVLFDVAKKKVLHQRKTALPLYPERALVSAGGSYAAIGMSTERSSTRPRVVMVWDVAEARRQRTFEINWDCLSGLAFNGDTLGMAVATWHDVQVFEPEQGEDPVLVYNPEEPALAMQFREQGMLALLLDDGTRVILRIKTGKVVRSVPPPTELVLKYSAANAEWSMFAAPTAGGVFVWKEE
jgi:WD40 repeat protein